MNNHQQDQKIDNTIAAIWSMMLPGLGQMMKNQIMPGIFWAIAVGFGYFSFFWPGLIFHALCIIDAAFNKGTQPWARFDTWQRKLTSLIILLLLLAYIVFRNF